MSTWTWATVIIVSVTVIVLALGIWRLSNLPPIFRSMLIPLSSTETLKTNWSAKGLSSNEYRVLLESNTRLDLSLSVLAFVERAPKPSFNDVISVLGPPDEFVNAERVLEQYGDNEWHDKCVCYRLGRYQSALSDHPKMDQFFKLQICFKDGRATVPHVAGLDRDDPLANFSDTRMYQLD